MAPLHRLRQAVTGLGLRARLPGLLRRGSLPRLLSALDRVPETGEPPGDDPSLLAAWLFRPLRFWPNLRAAYGVFVLEKLPSAGPAPRQAAELPADE